MQLPRYLVVVRVPQDEAEWVEVDPAETTLRRAARWLDLREAEPLPDGQASGTVHLPPEALLTQAALRRLVLGSSARAA